MRIGPASLSSDISLEYLLAASSGSAAGNQLNKLIEINPVNPDFDGCIYTPTPRCTSEMTTAIQFREREQPGSSVAHMHFEVRRLIPKPSSHAADDPKAPAKTALDDFIDTVYFNGPDESRTFKNLFGVFSKPTLTPDDDRLAIVKTLAQIPDAEDREALRDAVGRNERIKQLPANVRNELANEMNARWGGASDATDIASAQQSQGFPAAAYTSTTNSTQEPSSSSTNHFSVEEEQHPQSGFVSELPEPPLRRETVAGAPDQEPQQSVLNDETAWAGYGPEVAKEETAQPFSVLTWRELKRDAMAHARDVLPKAKDGECASGFRLIEQDDNLSDIGTLELDNSSAYKKLAPGNKLDILKSPSGQDVVMLPIGYCLAMPKGWTPA